jgi:hypothetical protein
LSSARGWPYLKFDIIPYVLLQELFTEFGF